MLSYLRVKGLIRVAVEFREGFFLRFFDIPTDLSKLDLVMKHPRGVLVSDPNPFTSSWFPSSFLETTHGDLFFLY
jgi:hypothetical protein